MVGQLLTLVMSFHSKAVPSKFWWIGTLTVRPATKISSSVITVDSSDDEAFRNFDALRQNDA